MEQRKRIQRLTGFTVAELNQMQFDTAYEYLRETLRLDDWSISQLTGSSIFWNWWINHWNRRDECCLRAIGERNRYSNTARQIYLRWHDPKTLEVYPNRVILEESYSEMIDELIKSETQ